MKALLNTSLIIGLIIALIVFALLWYFQATGQNAIKSNVNEVSKGGDEGAPYSIQIPAKEAVFTPENGGTYT